MPSIDIPSTSFLGLEIPALHIGASVLILVGILLVMFLIFKIFSISLKIFLKFLINALIGAVLLYVLNFVFGQDLLNVPMLTLPINWVTTSVAGLLGVPGIVIMLILNVLL